MARQLLQLAVYDGADGDRMRARNAELLAADHIAAAIALDDDWRA